jgi:hypothetical protein
MSWHSCRFNSCTEVGLHDTGIGLVHALRSSVMAQLLVRNMY